MPEFAYRAVTADGSEQTSTLIAVDETSALNELKDRGLVVFEFGVAGSLDQPAWYAREIEFGTRIGSKGVAELSRLLATLIDAQLPIGDALKTASELVPDKRLRQILPQVRQRVLDGTPLDRAFAEHNKALPDLFLSLVSIGQRSNRLGEVLADCASHFEKEGVVRSKLISSAIYPAILVCTAVALMLIVAFYLAPSLAPFFAANDTPMPWALQALASLAELDPRSWVIALFCFVSIVFGLIFFSTSKSMAEPRSVIIGRLPVVGPVIRNAKFGRYARTLSIMLASGEGPREALRALSETASAPDDEDLFADAADLLAQGQSASAIFDESSQVPSLFAELYMVGEKTNRLSEMMRIAGETLERSATTGVERLLALATPILTLVIGLSVGYLVYTMLGAILDVTDFAV